MSPEEEARVIDLLSERLHDKFPTAPAERMTQVVNEIYHQYDGRPIREFVPVLVEREATDRFRDQTFA